MKPVAKIESGSEWMNLYADGTIGRATFGPSGEWRITGAVERNNLGGVRQTYTLAEILRGRVDSAGDWKFKNGKQRTFVRDLDHGTPREWRSPGHRIVIL